MLDYGTLKILWWLFIFILFAFFFILGGRDLGVCILLPIVGKKDEERRLLINTIGPTWEGNQVWLVTAGGALFAAWPLVYAAAFSGLYFAFFLVLLALILRPPGIDFRSKLPSRTWRNMWDTALFVSGFVSTLVLGIGLGNVLLGVPFHFDDFLRSYYTGHFFQLLNPFSIAMGLAAVSLISLQAGIFLQGKLEDEFTQRLKKLNLFLGSFFLILFVFLGYWTTKGINGYLIQSIPMSFFNESIIPASKEVIIASQGWSSNYVAFPWLWALPGTVVAMTILTLLFSLTKCSFLGLLTNSVAIVASLATVNAALFPFILPSSTHPSHSLTLWDSVSSHLTLQYMFWATIILLPIILLYTRWVFRVLKGKAIKEEILSKVESY